MSYDDAMEALSSDALKLIKNNQVIGLGSGRAATSLVKSLAKLIKLKNYNIKGIPTSLQIKLVAEKAGIQLVESDQVNHIDIVFDGADQIDSVKKLGGESKIRSLDRGYPFFTENGNIILDCDFGTIKNPKTLTQKIKQIPGVLESGIFLRKPDIIYKAKTNGKFEII